MNKDKSSSSIDKSVNKNEMMKKWEKDRQKKKRKLQRKKEKLQRKKKQKAKPIAFLKRYANRIEKVTKEGIQGIVRHVNIQINMPKKRNRDNTDSDTDSEESEDEEDDVGVLPLIKRESVKPAKKSLMERYNERQEKRVLYRPYSLKDYRRLPDENSIKLGKLEPDLDTEDLRKKKEIRAEVMKYSKNLVAKGVGLTMKKMPVSSLAHKVKVKSENELSPLYLGKLYGREINSHNMLREQERRRLLKMMISNSSNSADSKLMKSGISPNNEQYMLRLKRFKETLLPEIKAIKATKATK